MLVKHNCGHNEDHKNATKKMVTRLGMQKCSECSGVKHNKQIWDYALTQEWSSEQMNAYYKKNKI